MRHKREETVEENIAHYAHKDLTIGTDGPLDLKSQDKAITVEAGQAIQLKVGNSVITITKESVTVDSTRVDVNP